MPVDGLLFTVCIFVITYKRLWATDVLISSIFVNLSAFALSVVLYSICLSIYLHVFYESNTSPASEQILPKLKLRLIKELKIKKRLLNETTTATSACYSHTSDSRGCFPSRFPHGHSRGLPISGRGSSPLSRGVSSSRRGTPFLHDRRPSRLSPRYSAVELAHVKQHIRCIECGAYGHWRQECPRLIPTRHVSVYSSTETMRDYRSSCVHFADASPSLPSLSSISSLTSEVSPLPAENIFSHDDHFP